MITSRLINKKLNQMFDYRHRLTFSVRRLIIKSVLGEELANSTILSSSRVVPTRFLKIGYKFVFHLWNQS
jgi:NAD dependent epimerase/dehydratase family enzyme